jgi:hypothetical protein
MERTSEEFNRKAFRLEFLKPATGMSSGLRKIGTGLCGGVDPLQNGRKSY